MTLLQDAAGPSWVDNSSMTIRVLVADDHTLVRQGIRQYLETAGDIEVVG